MPLVPNWVGLRLRAPDFEIKVGHSAQLCFTDMEWQGYNNTKYFNFLDFICGGAEDIHVTEKIIIFSEDLFRFLKHKSIAYEEDLPIETTFSCLKLLRSGLTSKVRLFVIGGSRIFLAGSVFFGMA